MTGEGMSDEAIWSVHAAFATTEYGQRLSDNIRYARYNLAELSNHQWVRLLGADVNNLTHMPLTYGCTKSFVRLHEELAPGTLAPEDASILKLAAIVHDQGEAIVGDITYSDKTSADEDAEKQAVLDYIADFTPGIDPTTRDTIKQAFTEVVFDRMTDLGAMFNAIERIGYMRTGLRASSELLRNSEPHALAGLRWLIADVLAAQPAALVVQANRYPVVKVFLGANQDLISAAFRWPEPTDFSNYRAFEEIKSAAFAAAKANWFSELRV
jgi:hypothetical protein